MREAAWSSTRDTTSSWSKTVAQEAGRAADTVLTAVDKGASAVDDLAHELSDPTQKIDVAAEKFSTAKTDVASGLADEVTEEPGNTAAGTR